MKLSKISAILISLFIFAACSKNADSQPGVFFIGLTDGQKVKSPFKVQMGVMGKVVAPAGEIKEGTGHHHIIINSDGVADGQVIPADEKHLHFGKGQTETELTLAPGKYKLTLQFANGAHLSYGEEWSKTIHIEVE